MPDHLRPARMSHRRLAPLAADNFGDTRIPARIIASFIAAIATPLTLPLSVPEARCRDYRRGIMTGRRIVVAHAALPPPAAIPYIIQAAQFCPADCPRISGSSRRCFLPLCSMPLLTRGHG
jgi:hypothetical protein